MVGQFFHLRQGDQEQMASRVTFELEEQTAAAVREEELRSEYAREAENLRADYQQRRHSKFNTSSINKMFLHRLDLGQLSQP